MYIHSKRKMSSSGKARKKSKTTAKSKSSMKLTAAGGSGRRNLAFNEPPDDDEEAVEPVNNACACGPNFYEKVFGPTADESLLVGLQTVIALCEERPKEESSIDSTPQTPQTSDTEDNDAQKASSSDSSQTPPCKLKDCCSQTGDQLLTGSSQTDYRCCSTCAQTAAPSVKATCSQTACPKVAAGQHGKPCVKCIGGPTCPQPGKPCCHCFKVCKPCCKSRSTSKRAKVKSIKASSDSCCCCVGTESDASPVSCYCSDPTSQSQTEKWVCPKKSTEKSICPKKSTEKLICPKKSTLKPSSLCSCCRSTVPDTTTGSSKRCTCSTSKAKSRRQVTVCDCHTSTSSSGIEDTEETENSMEMGDSNDVCVRYAITKISKFCTYTTFEVMKSTSKKPKVMPKTLEGVFVLKNCNE